MIKKFKENPIRATGVINRGMFEQVKMLYMQNPAAGGELAISLMEQVLTGDHSSDDFMVEFAIANHKETIERNQTRYDASREAKHEAIEDSLREIAELYNQGFKQAEIARKLKMTASNVSKKVSKIRKEFPNLLKDGNVSNVSTVSGNLESLETLGNVSNVDSVSNVEETLESVENVSKNLETLNDVSNVSKVDDVSNVSGNMEILETNLESQETFPKFPSFQSFQHVNVNDNVNVNVAGKASPPMKKGEWVF